jgi:hypothetical protein
MEQNFEAESEYFGRTLHRNMTKMQKYQFIIPPRLSTAGVGNLSITAGHICYSHLWRGLQKKINNVVDSKQNLKSIAGIHLKTDNGSISHNWVHYNLSISL